MAYSFAKRTSNTGSLFEARMARSCSVVISGVAWPASSSVVWNTLGIALWVTLACLVVGYPAAFALARAGAALQIAMLVAIILPLSVGVVVKAFAWQIVLRHALKPALLPVVSYLGPATAAVITGSVVIEQIFSVPGIGRFFVTGALNRDYTLVMGVVVFYGVLIIAFNFLVDIAYAWLDPKVKYR